jgi:hypothetical protein
MTYAEKLTRTTLNAMAEKDPVGPVEGLQVMQEGILQAIETAMQAQREACAQLAYSMSANTISLAIGEAEKVLGFDENHPLFYRGYVHKEAVEIKNAIQSAEVEP